MLQISLTLKYLILIILMGYLGIMCLNIFGVFKCILKNKITKCKYIVLSQLIQLISDDDQRGMDVQMYFGMNINVQSIKYSINIYTK